MEKRFLKRFLSITVTALFLFAAFIAYIDPFFHYHKPIMKDKVYIHDELNQNPGIAEHFEYDSVIIGSSMTQNFTVSKFDKKFRSKTVKLTYSAIRTGNMRWMFEKVFKNHDVANVFLGLDLDSFVDAYGYYQFPLPEYMYDDNPFNDVNYVLNKEIAIEALDYLEKVRNNKIPPVDDAYKWNASFSKENALASVDWNMFEYQPLVHNEQYMKNTEKNFTTNVFPFIKAHPETTFYVFFPPYSLLWWNMKLSNGKINDFFDVETYLCEQLVVLDNVKLLGFQNVENIVTNLDFYKDYNHYSPEINDWIMEQLAEDQYVLTAENYKSYLHDLKELIYSFDYHTFEVQKP